MGLPEEDPPAGAPEWVVTYGDMMSLLLTFFILLAAFSEIKSEDNKMALVESIVAEFGDDKVVKLITSAMRYNRKSRKIGSTTDPYNSVEGHRDRASIGADGPPGKRNLVETIRQGDRSVIGGPMMFEPGTANLTADAKEVLGIFATHMRRGRYLIDVRGFESVTPIPKGSPFRDARQLAFARIRAVVDYLGTRGIDSVRCRLSIGAPIETTTLPRMSNGEPMLERLVITQQEAIRRDAIQTAVPVSLGDPSASESIGTEMPRLQSN